MAQVCRVVLIGHIGVFPMRRRPLVSCVSGIVKYADCAASWQIRMPSAHWALAKPIVFRHSQGRIYILRDKRSPSLVSSENDRV